MPAWPVIPLIVANLPEIMAGIGVLVLILTLAYMIQSIANRIGNFNLGIINIPIGHWFAVAAGGIVQFFTAITIDLISPLAAPFIAVPYAIGNAAIATRDALSTHAAQITHLHNVTIPKERAAAEAVAHAYTAQQTQGIRDQVHAAQLKWEAAHSITDAETYIALQRTAPSVEHALLAGFARTLIASHTYTDTLTAPLTDYLDGVHNRLHAGIAGQAQAAVRPVENAIAIPLPGTFPTGWDPAMIRTGEITAVGTAVAVIAEKIFSCLVSNCKGNNNFSNLLADALGIVSFVEFAAFVSSAIDNPAGAATEFAGEAKTLYSDADALFSTLIG